MSVFLMTAILAFGIWELIAFVRPGWTTSADAPGQPLDPSKRPLFEVPAWLFAAFMGILVVLASWFLAYAVMRWVHRPWGVSAGFFDALIGRNAASILLGAATGVLFGRLFDRAFHSTANFELTAKDRITIGLLVVVLALGLGGEEVIRGLGQRISKVSVGGTEIAFYQGNSGQIRPGDPSISSTSSSSISSGGQAGYASGTLPYDASGVGLDTLAYLNQIVDRDGNYVHMLDTKQPSASESTTAKPAAQSSFDLDRTLLQPALDQISLNITCLESYYQATGNTYIVNNLLSRNLPKFQQLRFGKEIAQPITFNFNIVAKTNQFEFADGFSDDSTKDTCLHNVLPVTITTDQAAAFSRGPYAVIIYASLLAQLANYEAALTTLKAWTDSQAGAGKTPGEKWLRTRVLFVLTQITEEWIRKRDAQVPSSLRKFHIDRLHEVEESYSNLFGMRSYLTKNAQLKTPVDQDEFLIQPDEQNTCSAKNDDTRRVFNSWVSTELAIASHELLHPDYSRRYAPEVSAIVHTLLRTNFGCFPDALASEVTRRRADSLAVYARMALADARSTQLFKDKASLDQQIDNASRAVELGIKLLGPAYDADPQSAKSVQANSASAPTLLELISSSPTIESFEDLLSLQRSIEDFQASRQ